jgi:hypothetical protein
LKLSEPKLSKFVREDGDRAAGQCRRLEGSGDPRQYSTGFIAHKAQDSTRENLGLNRTRIEKDTDGEEDSCCAFHGTSSTSAVHPQSRSGDA